MTNGSLTLFFVVLIQSVGCMQTRPPSPATQSALRATPADFGPNVLVFDPASPDIQKQIDALHATQEAGQFNDKRYAILFKPGKYDLDVNVGFYTQVLGVGVFPDDVQITGAVRSKAKWMTNSNATCNFWRGVENLSITPTTEGDVNVWAVSQGTAMRRVHIRGDLHLSDGGWSSGGFLADSVVDGTVDSGSQQQWLSRNCDFGKWIGGNWNMVFVGVKNAPKGEWPEKPYTTIEQTPISTEKPFLGMTGNGSFQLWLPFLTENAHGASWTAYVPSINELYIARCDRDDAASINAALRDGKDILLTPGIYHLDASLRVTKRGTRVLGIGYPTLVADRGAPAMTIATEADIQVGGILFEAGTTMSPTLLEVGEQGRRTPVEENLIFPNLHSPIRLFDIYCRAGGASVGQTKSFIEINASNVVADNLWLWRADHGTGHAWDENKNENGLIVNGDDVTIYGLFVEHTQGYQTLWNGERGRVYLYQSEMPYDAPDQAAWQHDGKHGYASYKVADHVKEHEAWGLGIYGVFHASAVVADSAIEAPNTPGVKFHNMLTRKITGQPGSGIAHVINDRGDASMNGETVRLRE